MPENEKPGAPLAGDATGPIFKAEQPSPQDNPDAGPSQAGRVEIEEHATFFAVMAAGEQVATYAFYSPGQRWGAWCRAARFAAEHAAEHGLEPPTAEVFSLADRRARQ